MPIQIDRSKAHDLALRWDEALELVRNEFEGLDPHHHTAMPLSAAQIKSTRHEDYGFS